MFIYVLKAYDENVAEIIKLKLKILKKNILLKTHFN